MIGDTALYEDAVALLKQLIEVPSLSKEENHTADILEAFLNLKGVSSVHRFQNNVWAVNKYADDRKPYLLLNSHHDTVKPNASYTRDPFQPAVIDGRLFGLGSNDAGGSVVSLISAFLYFYDRDDLPWNLVLAITGEEEISGKNGIEILLPRLPMITLGIVGEPTLMNPAIAEKGLMVLDCTVAGVTGHAARNEGVNAIYKALPDIEWFRTFGFPRVSPLLGPVKMSVTVIRAGEQHNVVPERCTFVVDVRITELYTHEEVLEIIRQHVSCVVVPRSCRLRSSGIALEHPLVKAAEKTGGIAYGSPTSSDQALMPFVTMKMGPGDSARSHMADEFIYLQEIRQGIEGYIQLLQHFFEGERSA